MATGLTTVATAKLVEFIKQYVEKEDVERIVVGLPTTMRGEQSESMKYITPGINRLRQELPGMEIVFFDERFTSVLAHKSMLASGMKKTDRQDKAIVDEISATIILNDYLQSKLYNQ